MKIGIDCRLWNETGVGRYIRNLVFQLSKIDKINKYVLFLLENDINDKNIPANFDKVVVNIKWHSFKEQIVFPFILLKHNLDLLHVPYINPPILYFKPFVFTVHDLTVLKFPTGRATTLPYPFYWVKRLAYILCIYLGVLKAKAVLCVSETTKKDVVKTFHCSPSKLYVTYNSVDENLKSPSNKTTRGEYLLYVGNAHPHKNLENLLKAFALNIKKTPNIKLYLVGKMDFFYKRLKNSIPNALADKVIFTGYLSDEDLAFTYANSKAVIVPSMYEGFGIPVLEAFKFKKVVLCSNIPSLHEVAENAAIYFDPADYMDIAAKINLVMAKVFKPAAYLREGDKILSRFSWAKTAKKTLSVYESCTST